MGKKLKSVLNHSRSLLSVKKILSKLRWPTKKKHYDRMHKFVTDTNTTYKKIGDKIIINNLDTANAIVHQIKNSKMPSKWFNFYAPNIGKYTKTDSGHMFPFVLDTVLDEWPCIEKQDPDKKNPTKMNTLLYFYGEFNLANDLDQTESKLVPGCFEYFINSFGALFHRMFRPLHRVCPDVRTIIDNSL